MIFIKTNFTIIIDIYVNLETTVAKWKSVNYIFSTPGTLNIKYSITGNFYTSNPWGFIKFKRYANISNTF